MRRLLPSSLTHCTTKYPTGSWTDKRISLMANTINWLPPIWTLNCVMIWNVWRRSALIAVSVTTGVSVSVVNTPRLPVVVVALSVYPRRSRFPFVYLFVFGMLWWLFNCSFILYANNNVPLFPISPMVEFKLFLNSWKWIKKNIIQINFVYWITT